MQRKRFGGFGGIPNLKFQNTSWYIHMFDGRKRKFPCSKASCPDFKENKINYNKSTDDYAEYFHMPDSTCPTYYAKL